jgi:peroxiredoxin family protein/TusA-related sulfurtransferase/rhodanese-related sulfurtransferase
VRTPIEFETGSLPGAINLEVDHLRNNLHLLGESKDRPIVVNCQVGLRAYVAIMILKNLGYTNLYNLSGGYSTYKAYKYELNSSTMILSKAVDFDETTGMSKSSILSDKSKVVDVSGMQCPGPLMATYKAVQDINEGDGVKIIATDPGFAADVKAWAKTNGHDLLSLNLEGNKYIAEIVKGKKNQAEQTQSNQENATIVLFSGELDKALASMIIAQGAAAQGKHVSIFFTFWGLNTLRKEVNVPVKKNFIERMFGFMMPRGANKLPLSSMNMMGMGALMIKGLMKHKNVDQLPIMIKDAQALGVKFIACQMSMDLMGIKHEELIDGVEIGGVGTYIANNENVGTTLFI